MPLGAFSTHQQNRGSPSSRTFHAGLHPDISTTENSLMATPAPFPPIP
eukprot:CAMPEP_0118992264 /NCGR_PEP_ID=MMETSP1173-20130426/53079_1 /TAXON_ID=1034831 /ORGANISM="Rhizochromulina marina cf, Strain CCMP1243" /LENGTH=47 /DNA_ID= /DNA_START= /DNA_END= /DNA_ORIENTATION=